LSDLVDNLQDRAGRRPDKQFAKVVLGSVGVYFDGFAECDAVNAEVSVPLTRLEVAREIAACRVGVFLVIAWI